MYERPLYISEIEEKKMSMMAYFEDEYNDTNEKQRERMKKLLSIAIKNELTERQKQCIIMKFYQNMTAQDIAKELNIRPVTVYKHIRVGLKAMKHAAVYL